MNASVATIFGFVVSGFLVLGIWDLSGFFPTIKQTESYLPPFIALIVILAITIGAGVIAWRRTMKRTDLCESYAAMLDARLASYAPVAVDKHAYAQLQQSAKAVGFIERGTINGWIARETAAIEKTMQQSDPITFAATTRTNNPSINA